MHLTFWEVIYETVAKAGQLSRVGSDQDSSKVDESAKIGTKVVYSLYFKNLVSTTKNFKMAAKNPRWPPKIWFFLIIFYTINIFDLLKEINNLTMLC